MATHSSVLAWRIPGTGEPGGLPSVGLRRVRHNWSDLAAAACSTALSAFVLCARKGHITFPVGTSISSSVKYEVTPTDH